VAKIDEALVEALADPAVQRRFTDVGQGTWPREMQNPKALAAQQKAEIEKWWPIVKAAGIKAQ
jgi:tripartite-type tricarboxylate transporter receptor subunit TctC